MNNPNKFNQYINGMTLEHNQTCFRRIDPKKYWQTTDNCENFCTACFYQYDCGFSGKELEQIC